jgi:hypothetical protein
MEKHRNQDSSVTVLASYKQDDWVQPLTGTEILPFTTASKPALGPTKLPVLDTACVFTREKWLGHKPDQSSAEGFYYYYS